MVARQIQLGGHKYQGADILLIHRYNGQDTIITFAQRNHRGPYVNIAGGRCETKHRDLEDTASVELYEESRKSIFIASDILRDMTKHGSFVDYPGDSHHGLPGRRRCFVARVPHASTTLYSQNKRILDSLPVNHRLEPFRETDAMIRIPVADIEATVKAGDDGHARIINGVNVSRFTVLAFIRAKAAGLLASPYDLGRVRYEQKANDNRDATGIKSGRIDIYRF
jgi:hypothetical protein